MAPVDWADDTPGPVSFPEPFVAAKPEPEGETETAEIRLRVEVRRLPGVTNPLAEIVRDLAVGCDDHLRYQDAGNENAYVVVERVEIIE